MREQSFLGLAESNRTTPEAISHSPTNPLTCTTCGRTYSRIDHLERHSRSHTHLKPFVCTTCGKAFARVDALKRHEGNHDDESPAKRRKVSDAPPRARAGQACQSCAAAKLRCEDEKPCARCKRKGIICEYAKSNPGFSREHNGSITLQNTYGHALSLNGGALGIDIDAPSPANPQRTEHHNHDVRRSLPQASAPSPLATTANLDGEHFATRASAQMENMNAFSPMPDMFGESSLAEFLTDIMLPPATGPADQALGLQTGQTHTQKDFLDFGTSWLDFVELDALLTDHNAEVGLKPNNHVSFQPLPPSGSKTPLFGQSFDKRNAAFSRSIWRWTPTKKDHGGPQHLNLSLPLADMNSPETRSAASITVPGQRIEPALRDQILALILSTCDKSMYSDVVSSFPSIDLLNGLLHHFLNTQFCQIDSWLHVPTFSVEEQQLELLTAIIAAGGVTSSMPALRKLGFALHESARDAVAVKFESDNRYTRNLDCIQALTLTLQMGLWSGDKRKMEIAESFLQPPITMMRRAGRLSRSKGGLPPPTLQDSAETLQSKWREWVNAESYKRLAIHLMIHDAQASMAQQTPPLLSPAEMTLDLPESRNLWCADTAEAWRNIYLQEHGVLTAEKSLSIAQSISHVSMIREQPGVDIQLSAMVAVYCVWAAVWSHLQFNSLLRFPTPSHGASETLVVSNSWDSGLSQLLDRFHLMVSDWNDFRPPMALVLERVLLNMHISFEQVQLFAGKEGEEEARRVLPLLQHWSTTSDARQAVWHAGQILKAARRCPQRNLRDFQAVCLYHAGMTFWTYALVSASISDQQDIYMDNQATRSKPAVSVSERVWLDGEDCQAVQRFIALNRGTPVVCSSAGEVGASDMLPVRLDNPRAIMSICTGLLKGNSPMEEGGTPLPLVENLSQLMHDLGIAAHELLQGSLRRSREVQTAAG